MPDDTVTLIVPTFNERDNLEPLVQRVHAAMNGRSYELLIVDDNSTDGTIDIGNRLSEKYPLRMLVRTRERGLSTAVIHGIKNSRGSIVGVMDADLQHPPEVLPSLLGAMEDGADMVVASRYIPGGGVPNWGLLRRVISKGAGTIAHLFLPKAREIHDPMSGFFMFRRDRVDPNVLKPKGYKIALEIFLMGNFTKPMEVPFIFEERSAGSSKLKWSTQVDYLQHILSLMNRTGELRMFILFLIVGLTGVGVNLGIYTLMSRVAGLSGDLDWIAVLIGIEVSIITNFLLNDTFTFRNQRAGRGFLGRFFRFNLTCLTGAGIQTGLFLLFTRIFGVHDILSDFIGIVVASLFNYFINRNWTWR